MAAVVRNWESGFTRAHPGMKIEARLMGSGTAMPGHGMMKTQAFSPRNGSGMATSLASATAGCWLQREDSRGLAAITSLRWPVISQQPFTGQGTVIGECGFPIPLGTRTAS